MKRFHSLLQASRLQKTQTAGFTFLELVIAIALTTVMLAMAGTGVVAVLRADQQSASEITRRTNLNRALEFMTDEVRMAKAIATPASGDIPTPACGTATGVLALTMPNNSRILYYVHNEASCTTVWTKPAVIHRIVGTDDSVLVDAVMAPTTTPTCSTTLVGASGFYACIDSNQRSTMLYLYGKQSEPASSSTATYAVSSQVSARSF